VNLLVRLNSSNITNKSVTVIPPTANAFYMYYFVLTGIHLIHVVIGLLVLTALRASFSRSKTPPTSMIFTEGAACFWHLVDLLWIILFPLLFLVR
jgi:nitric oxide reductase NorE protein